MTTARNTMIFTLVGAIALGYALVFYINNQKDEDAAEGSNKTTRSQFPPPDKAVQAEEDAERYAPELLSGHISNQCMPLGDILSLHAEWFRKPMPVYATKIRGYSWSSSEADIPAGSWVFEIPAENQEEFERYLVELGIPEDGLLKPKYLLDRGHIPHPKHFEVDTKDAGGLVHHSTSTMPSTRSDAGSEFGIPTEGTESFVYRILNPKISDSYISLRYFSEINTVRVSVNRLEWW